MDDESKAAAEEYRAKAVEVRGKAALMNDPGLRETMLRIAQDYDHMADVLKNLGDIQEQRKK